MPKKKSVATKSSSLALRLASPNAYRLRRSRVHGTGLFAMRTIPKGTRLIEYTGERISHAEADRRHENKAADDNHTFFFTIDTNTVIDAGVRGNAARFINHSCTPNCEVVMIDGRPIVETLSRIAQGDEFSYDYNLTREPEDGVDAETLFGCKCGAPTCRGTMLAPSKKTESKAPLGKGKSPASPSKKTERKSKASPRNTKATEANRAKARAKTKKAGVTKAKTTIANGKRKPKTAKPGATNTTAKAKRSKATAKARAKRR